MVYRSTYVYELQYATMVGKYADGFELMFVT